jgi:hypothetical protein
MQRVRGELDRLGETPGQRIADVLKFLVHHRGIEAEHALISAFGQARLNGFYNGEEPFFSELEELASILCVPLSIFQIVSRGDFAELEIAWAEILYHARGLDRREREKLALSLVEFIRDERGDDISLLEKLHHRKAKS